MKTILTNLLTWWLLLTMSKAKKKALGDALLEKLGIEVRK